MSDHRESSLGGLTETLEVFKRAGSSGTPFTAEEVADELGCDPRTAQETLEELADNGELETKTVSPDNRIWWAPTDSIRSIQPDKESGFDQTQFQELVQEVSDYAIFVLDRDGHIRTWNAGAKHLKGYDRAEAVGEHFSMLYTEEDQNAGRPERNLRKAERKGKVEDEGWRVRKDGSTFWANVTITTLYDDDDAVRGFIKITQDISDRHAYEQQLRHEKERFQMLVREVKDYAIFLLEPDGTIRTWNEGAKNLKGYEKEEIIGEHFSTLYTEADREAGRPETNLEKAAEQGRMEDEGWRIRKDGSTFWANVTITALYDNDGEIRGFAKVTRDMTERHEYEQKIQDERERLEFMNRIVRHNVLNGLNVVVSRTAMLQSHLSDDPEAQQFLETIDRRVDDLASLIDTMREFMDKVVSGDPHETEPVAIRDQIESKVQLARESYPDAVFECHSLPAESTRVIADDLVGEVFENVLSNAVLHNDQETPHVEVWASETTQEVAIDEKTNDLLLKQDMKSTRPRVEVREQPAVAVHIADNGPGISDKMKEEIFTGAITGSVDSEGGFGLYLVQEMMDSYGGSVHVRDRDRNAGESDPGGTVFDLVFVRTDDR